MASVGPGRYVVIVLHVGGSKLADFKLVLQREPRSGKIWFPVGSISPDEELVDADARELHEETGLILTLDDLTLLSDAPVRVDLPVGQQLLYVYSAFVLSSLYDDSFAHTCSARAGCHCPFDYNYGWFLRRTGDN
jgi:8-oxo-dGTP pyrophosphatase MutT (NUDIX family)